MWRSVSNSFLPLTQHASPRRVRELSGSVLHTHSPRTLSSDTTREGIASAVGPAFGPTATLFQRPGHIESLSDRSRGRWRYMSSDNSMPDYSSSTSDERQSRRLTGPPGLERSERMIELIQSSDFYESLREACPPVPVNTPQDSVSDPSRHPTPNSSGSSDLGSKLHGMYRCHRSMTC